MLFLVLKSIVGKIIKVILGLILIKKVIKIIERLEEISKDNKNLESILEAQFELILINYYYLESKSFDLDLIRKILSIKIKEVSIDEIKIIIANINIKILIRLTLAKVKGIENSIYNNNKKELLEIVKILLKTSKAIDSKKISLTKLEKCLVIVKSVNSQLDEALKTKTN
jgi:hypothetical protein